jgi:hypothetical protein
MPVTVAEVGVPPAVDESGSTLVLAFHPRNTRLMLGSEDSRIRL